MFSEQALLDVAGGGGFIGRSEVILVYPATGFVSYFESAVSAERLPTHFSMAAGLVSVAAPSPSWETCGDCRRFGRQNVDPGIQLALALSLEGSRG